MWNPEYLQQVIRDQLSDYRLIVVSNRQPYSHVSEAGKIICRRQPGGLVTALMPVMEAVHGTWIALGTSPYDRFAVDSKGRVQLPPEKPSYTLRRIFLSKQEMDAYYYGYCNEGLWPLSHISYTRPHFRAADWKAYERANEVFAQAILEEIGDDKAFVWVQDYHLILVAKYLKLAGRANIITSLFWHIPWPNPETFGICPQKKEILEGLLAYDLLGFQIRYHGDNFLAAVDREIESRIDREKNSVIYQAHETQVRPFPISIDGQAIASQADSEASQARGAALREALLLGDRKLVLGVDRIDYTKGIPDKLRAIDRFLEKYPQYHEKVVFVEVGELSRIRLACYKRLNEELSDLADEINWKHSKGAWTPIVLIRSYVPYADILAFYRSAEICVVSSLHDGMNLVAKEFVASRPDLGGVLVLSRFTGAARELTDALLINPYDPESFADVLAQALEMPEEEKQKRMQKMREVVEKNNIYRWAGKTLSQLLRFEFQEV